MRISNLFIRNYVSSSGKIDENFITLYKHLQNVPAFQVTCSGILSDHTIISFFPSLLFLKSIMIVWVQYRLQLDRFLVQRIDMYIVLHDVPVLSRSLFSISFRFVPRQGNVEADKLASSQGGSVFSSKLYSLLYEL